MATARDIHACGASLITFGVTWWVVRAEVWSRIHCVESLWEIPLIQEMSRYGWYSRRRRVGQRPITLNSATADRA